MVAAFQSSTNVLAVRMDGQVSPLRLQTNNFRLFLRKQTDKQQI